MNGASLRVAVIGGGIGGLTAALSLRRAGFEVDVYEQAPELTQIGGGINMGPNAARILRRLGLAAGFPVERIHLGHRLAGLENEGGGAAAWFENGARITADVLVGADGIHSAVRAALFGEEAPRFAGCVAYRGLVPIERLADLALDTGNQSWVGPGAHLVHYPVSRGRLLNFVGWTEHDTWNREDWTDRATVERALAAFEGWHPQVRRIIAAADACFIWALFDRDPLQHWSVGRTTLLGDACHPMYPFMGQGAAQAIEDGAALAACLSTIADPATALRHYERLRLPRVTRLQDMSRANKIRFHMRDGPAQEARDAEWGRAADRSPDALRWLYAFDAGAVEPMVA